MKAERSSGRALGANAPGRQVAQVTRMPSLQWTVRGNITEEVRAALAQALACQFDDEADARDVPFFGCRDVRFTAAVDPGHVVLVARYRRASAYPTHPKTLQSHVEFACLTAGLPQPGEPTAVSPGDGGEAAVTAKD